MIPQLPQFVNIVFGIIVLISLAVFIRASNFNLRVILILGFWIVIQSLASLLGFYLETSGFPPRFILLLLPPVLLILCLFLLPVGRVFIDSLDTKRLVLIHAIRVFVEIVLFWLFIYKMIPINMTFEGQNFDIISGLTTPFIYYFGYAKNKIHRNILLAWNFICLGLLVNVVINSILSSPFSFQKFGLDQPNIAILYFPFSLLPAVVVPLVLFSHLVLIRKAFNRK
jgi:hypothetical protein